MEKTPKSLMFLKDYTCIATSDDTHIQLGQKHKCRFCCCSEPEVTFNNRAHIIPEVIGRNNCICFYECDTCNNKFSRFEKDLGQYFSPYLTLLAVKGKRKINSFQSRSDNYDKSTLTTVNVDESGNRNFSIGDHNDFILNKDIGTGCITFRIPRHRPLYVYIALLKLALTMLPEDKIEQYRHAINFILNNEKMLFSPIAYVTVLTKKMFARPYAEIY